VLRLNLVLTARHCVSDIVGGAGCAGTFGPPHAVSGLHVTTQPQFTLSPGDYHGVAEVITLPLDLGSPDPLLNSDGLCGRDQALLILASTIDAAEAIPLEPRLNTPPAAAELYSAAGYGATDDFGTDSGIRRRRDYLTVDCVGLACPVPFDIRTEWRGEAGTCVGDSGGPALDAQERDRRSLARNDRMHRSNLRPVVRMVAMADG
jgi:hypothetical protein